MNEHKRERLLDLGLASMCLVMVLAFMAPTAWQCAPDAQGRSVCRWIIDQAGSTDDWRYFAGVWEASRVALRDFHQLPSWNPYHCGGVVLFADPQAPFPGPLFLLTFLWAGTALAMKLWVALHLLAGALGAVALTRLSGANRPEGLLAAALVSTCGFAGLHFGGGHLSFTPFLLFPWVLYSSRRSLGDARWSVLTASLLALTVYEGGTYPLPLMSVGLAAELLSRLGHRELRAGIVRSVTVLGVLFPLLAGFRLVPILRYMSEHPRLVPLDDMMSLHEVLQTWIVKDHPRGFPGHNFVWPEYGDYLGVLPVALMVLGVFTAILPRDGTERARRSDLAVFVCLVWMALGNIPGFSLFGLLHELPVYRSLRVPSRFLYPATVSLAMLASGGLISARAWLHDQRLKPWVTRGFVALELLAAVAVAVDLNVTNARTMQSGGDPSLSHARASSDFHQTPGGDYGAWPSYPVRGVGTTQCYVPLEWAPAEGLWVDSREQFTLEARGGLQGDGPGVVRQLRWTPNAIDFDVTLRAPARLVINQNQESSWRASRGEIDRSRAILTVDLPAGNYALRVSHRAWGMRLGAAMTLLGLWLAWVFLRLKPSRRESLEEGMLARLREGGG